MNDKSKKLASSSLLEQYEMDFDSGDGSALLSAVFLCLNRGIDAPKWVVTGFSSAIMKYESGQSWTLDDAFNVLRRKGQRQKRVRKDVLKFVVWQKVVEHHNAGESIGRILFDRIADELSDETGELFAGLKFNGTDVQEAYYGVKSVTKKKKKTVTDG